MNSSIRPSTFRMTDHLALIWESQSCRQAMISPKPGQHWPGRYGAAALVKKSSPEPDATGRSLHKRTLRRGDNRTTTSSSISRSP